MENNSEEKGRDLAQYILSVLLAAPEVVMSWGFHSPERIAGGVAFQVNGFIHQGRVEIVYDSPTDLFSVRTMKEDGTAVGVEDDVFVDALVDTVDRMVELCEDYKERVMKEYGL